MRSELIVMTFERAGEALRVYEALRAMRKSQILALENAIIATEDSSGQVSLRQVRELPAEQGAPDRDLLSRLAELVFCAPREDGGRSLANVGLDERFREQVARAMGKGSSGLSLLVRSDSMSDVDELLSALTLFKGKIHRMTLAPQTEAALLA